MVRIETRPAQTHGTQHYGSSGGKQHYGSGDYIKADAGSKFRAQPSTGNMTPSRHGHKGGVQVSHSDVLRMNNLNENGGGKNGLHNVASKASKGDDDVDSQSSQTHIIRKVEWSLTEENTGSHPGVHAVSSV